MNAGGGGSHPVGGRSVRLETRHDRPEDVAACLSPDNTADIVTEVDGDLVVTTVTRVSTPSLRTTADDYLRNLSVAAKVLDG